MSDVSGIPYMGPMGQGNFFAPQFSYNPQINPTAGYAAPAAYAQNVTNNLYSSGGGFGQQTNYYSGLGAQYSAAGMSPYGVFSEGGGGGGASPYQTTPDVWTTGASPFQGGGGSNGFGGSIYGGGLGGGYSGPSIDWGGVGRAAAGMNIDPYPGMSMPGGLNSPFSAPSGAGAFNWSDLWSGGGGARADPAPGMAMPGGLGSPMSVPFQSPSTDYRTFQGAGASGYTSGIAPDTTGGRDFEWPTANPAPGMAMPGGLGSPTTTMLPAIEVDEPAKAQDQAPFDLSGPTTGWNSAPAAMPDSKAVLGYDPQQFAETDMSNFPSPATNYATFQAGSSDTSDTGKSADALAEDARQRLADVISGEPTKEAVETAKAVEGGMADFQSPATDYSAFQQSATPRTGYAADTDFLNKRGGHSSILKDGKIVDVPIETKGSYKPLNPEFAARLARAAKDFEAATGKRANFGEFSRGEDVQSIYYNRYKSGTGGIAAAPGHSRHQGGEAGDIARGEFRDWLQKNGTTYGLHFPVRGDPVHVQMNPSYRGPNYAQPDTPSRPPADIPFPQGVPLPAERPAGAPAPFGERQIYQDPNAPRPSTDIPNMEPYGPLAPIGPPAPPAAAGPSGVEKSQTFLNRSLESILQQHSPENLAKAGWVLDLKQPLREALNGPFGGQILSGLQPKLGQLGLTREDFAKAVADPRARFVEGGDFGPYPAYTGPEAAPGSSSYTSGIPPDTTGGRDFSGGGDVYSQFRQSENIEDRRGETGPIIDTPIDTAWWQDAPPLWSGDIVSETSMADFPSPATDYSAFQQPASRNDLAKTMTFDGFSPSPEPRQGGVGPPVELTPEHMRTMAEIESTQNPKLQDPGSSYRGLYQLSDAEFKKYGGTGSIFDAEQNTRAAMGKMTAEGQRAQDILGRALTPVEQYMVHQQGLAGTLSHLQNPDQPAWKSFQQASQWSDARAKTAIWDNLSNAMKAQFGNDVNNITSRDFIDMWTTKYYQKMVASGLPPGGFSDLPQ